MFDPYKEAEKINEQILKLFEKEELKKDNAMDWLVLTRTIKTNLDIIDHAAKQKLPFTFGNEPKEK